MGVQWLHTSYACPITEVAAFGQALIRVVPSFKLTRANASNPAGESLTS